MSTGTPFIFFIIFYKKYLLINIHYNTLFLKNINLKWGTGGHS